MDTVSSAVLDQLRRTKGWSLFISILIWLMAGYFVLCGVISCIMPLFFGVMEEEMPPGFPMGILIAFLIAFGLVLAGLGVMYGFVALRLTKFSTKITKLAVSPTEPGLVEVLNEQRAFWKMAGVTTITGIALYVVVMVVYVFAIVAISASFPSV